MKKVSGKFEKFVYLLILLHLAAALPFAYSLNIWIDEGSTLYTTQSVSHALANALQDEKQAPLYFWILSFWRNLNDSIFFARVFSVICSLAAIKIFSRVAEKHFSGKWLFLTTALFALHPYLFWASLEIRVYSLVILLSVLLTSLFDEGYLAENAEKSKKARIFYTIFAVVALYTNYYLGFLLVGNFFALLIQKRFKPAQTYFLQMLLAGIVFLPLAWAVKMQFSANSEGFAAEKSAAEGLRIMWNIFLTFALPTEIFPVEEISRISFFRLWLLRFALVAGLIYVIANRRKIQPHNLVYTTICGVIFSFLLAAYFLLGAVYVELRHAAVLFPPFVLFFWSFLETFFSAKAERNPHLQKVLITFLSVFYGLFFVYSIFTIHPNFIKRGDWARVSRFIEQNETPDQPIIVYKTFDALALSHQYAGKNKIYPDEKYFEWTLEDNPDSPKAFQKQTEFIISEIPPETREIWLVTDAECSKKVSCQPLENFVQENYTIIQQKDFYEENVRLLRKKLK